MRSRELREGARRIRLQDQPFEILRTMLERPGDVVTRDELRRRLWPDGTFVDFEHGLNAAVKRLRAALGDAADNPRSVETLPRRGYRFIANLDGAAELSDRAASMQAGPQVRLVVLPFANETHLWSELYDRDLSECCGLAKAMTPYTSVRPTLLMPIYSVVPLSSTSISDIDRERY